MARVYIILICFLFCSCTKEEITSKNYQCNDSWNLNSTNHPKSIALQTLLDDVTHKGLTGVMMTVQTPDGKTWTGTSGKIDLSTEDDLKPCHVSRIGSITKTFTAIIILKLLEQGKIKLDTPITTYLPTSVYHQIENSHQITIRNLLNHSSGIRDYTTVHGFTEFINEPKRIFSTEEYLRLNIYGKKALFNPGTSFYYSNANYGLLGMIAENVSSKKIEDLYQNYIFSPLNLKNTTFNKENPSPNHMARGYVDFNGDGKIFETTDWGVLVISPAAGILSNTQDLFKFEQALHNGQLISDHSYKEMTSFISVPTPQFNRSKYGLGLRYWDTKYGVGYGHSGGMYGYLAEAFYFPNSHVTYTLLVNCSFGTCNEIVDKELNRDVLDILFN